MKQAIQKFRSVPSFRRSVVGITGAVAALAGTAAFADAVTDAQAALAVAQTGGESVGGSVVAVVCALAVVGVIIALVRKV
ncbi:MULTISPECIES: major capsid protein [Pseudomonas syringae group]|uniref:Uncharacterized protein n=1 Tax=Pseudomonas syringae pv. persicae TaxID=237306 RepID=A0AB38EEV2_9PSED|nr:MULTISPECIES: major capsid protein [Pseudomonas syringae group]AZG86575.1 hypothetical protein N032_13485 [Pseudomonas syringae pv. pisi str. PP1]MCF5550414.1 hypothetical protein [Pseudomonas syringae]MCF5550421.1 hypothetical protein [Pseudomonas syringae]UZS64996.1 major capsid protein [Pseudomonas syringae]UZS65006.1 major capsid protein [Pseudomonas syringae]